MLFFKHLTVLNLSKNGCPSCEPERETVTKIHSKQHRQRRRHFTALTETQTLLQDLIFLVIRINCCELSKWQQLT